MGQTVTQTVVTRVAGEALTDKYFVVVDPANEGQVLHATAANMDTAVGCVVRGGAATAGDAVAVAVAGIVTAIAYGAINEGEYCVLHSTGAVKADPKTGSTTSCIVGKALEDAATGEQFELQILFVRTYNHA